MLDHDCQVRERVKILARGAHGPPGHPFKSASAEYIYAV